MPTSREFAVNRPLSGNELKELIREDFSRLLDNEGLLSHTTAFGRVSYRVRLTFHLDNIYTPQSESSLESHPMAKQVVEALPQMAAIEQPLPLADASDDSSVSALELLRQIESPNVERVRTGLPVPLAVRQQDGTTSIEQVQYPAQPELGDGDLTILDVTPEERAALGLPVLPSPPDLEMEAATEAAKAAATADAAMHAAVTLEPQP